MFRFKPIRIKPIALAAIVGLYTAPVVADQKFSGIGRAATPREIAAWDIDVRPDGLGLPKGRGSVEQGQVLYDAQCASCHGSFGESNQYMQIAGGVGSLNTDRPVRSTGAKLNYATTLWDYINRAMPFQAPKSLSANEVYALTAYVLHLNEILPEEAVLDEQSILAVRMPNREGFREDHGFKRVDGKPDVMNTACMKDCPVPPQAPAGLPDYVRNAHGNLALQVRALGPYRGADTTRPALEGALAAARAALTDSAGAATVAVADSQTRVRQLIKQHACTACHGIEQKIVGPALREVAKKWQGRDDAAQALLERIREGGSGAWGPVPMPPQSHVAESDLRDIVQWLLSGARP
ncbi:MAG: c-type cytochrome [Burkholderiales bacterium]